MAVKKTQDKAKINWGWPAHNEDSTKKKATKRQQQKKQNEIKRNAKMLGFKGIVTIIVIILIFGAIGVGATFYITRNDCFEIIGDDEITLTVDEKYFDEGVKVIEFSQDCSKKVEIETNLRQNADGSFSIDYDSDSNPIMKTYYIIYRVNTFKLSKLSNIKRIRLISFVENSEEIGVD